MNPLDHPALTDLGFGAAQLGNLYRAVDDDTATDAVTAAWEQGLRYFDTAPHYGLGLSERRVGAALAGRPRDEYVLSSKVGRLIEPNPTPTETDLDNGFDVPGDRRRRRDYTADGVLRSLEESLTRLGTDRIDIVYIHDPEEPTDRFDEALGGAVPALRRLKDEGVIGAWGVGSKDVAIMRRFVTEADPDVLMVAGRYTLLEQDDGLMRDCVAHGVRVVAVGVFNSGLLSQPHPGAGSKYDYADAPRELIDRANRIAEVCEAHGVSLPQAALAFPRRHPAVVNVCVGMRTREQVRRNIDLTRQAVPQDLWSDLVQHGLLKEER